MQYQYINEMHVLFQVSSSDLLEADEAIKKLGLAENPEKVNWYRRHHIYTRTILHYRGGVNYINNIKNNKG